MRLTARAECLAALGDREFDLLVVGGGITGCGVARDAALRGLRVALVEKQDFASGTSSRSSRLVHGGIRYLEHGHLRLVFESSAERRRLLRLAPHLVRPLAFTWPVYAGARVGLWKPGAAHGTSTPPPTTPGSRSRTRSARWPPARSSSTTRRCERSRPGARYGRR